MDASNQAIIGEKECFSHFNFTNMPRPHVNAKVYKNFNPVKRELSMKKQNSCMKSGEAFTKGYPNICPAKEFLYNFCKHKDHFGSLCIFKARKPLVSTAEEYFNNQSSE